MKQLFLDVTSSNYDGANGAICVIRKDAEIIQAGTTIYSMRQNSRTKNIKSL